MNKPQYSASLLRRNFLVLVVTRAIWSLGTTLPTPFFTLYALALGASPVEVGLISSFAIVSGMLVEPLGGYLADRKGRVKLVGFATIGFALSYIFYAVAPDWKLLAVGLFLSQASLFYTPGLNAILADSLPPGTRGKGYAIERTFPLALSIMSPYLGGLFIDLYGGKDEGLVTAMRQLYFIAVIVGLLVATIRLKFLKETLDTDAPDMSLRNIPQVLKESYGSVLDTVKWIPSYFRPVVILQVIQSFSIALAAPFWVLYASEILGVTTLSWGTLLLFSGISGLLLALPGGYLVDKFGSKISILLSMILGLLSVLFFMVSSSFWQLTIAFILLGASNTLVIPSFATLTANMIIRERRGRVFALIGEQGLQIATSRMFGGGILLLIPASTGAFLGGYLYILDKRLPFLILLTSLILGLLFTYIFIKEPRAVEE